MACNAVTDYLVRESGRIIPDFIARRVFPGSLWMNILQTTEWMIGMGSQLSRVIYDRQAPTAALPEWQDLTVESGQEGGLCLGPSQQVPIGSTTYSWSLKARNFRGPDFCAEDLAYPLQVMRQLEDALSSMRDYIRKEWEIRNRYEYFRAAKFKVAVTLAGPPVEESTLFQTTYPTTDATGNLTLSILENYRATQIREGLSESAMSFESGVPNSLAIVGIEQSANLIRDNGTTGGYIAQAFMGQGTGSPLLKALGAAWSLRGIVPMVDPFPRRFTFSGGVYTEVPAYITTVATKGSKAEVNPAWKIATKEESFLFDSSVVRKNVPRPMTMGNTGLPFNPVDYTGQWQLLNIPDRDCNPLATIVFPYARVKAGYEPINPERGVAFVHLRCSPSQAGAACVA